MKQNKEIDRFSMERDIVSRYVIFNKILDIDNSIYENMLVSMGKENRKKYVKSDRQFTKYFVFSNSCKAINFAEMIPVFYNLGYSKKCELWVVGV